MVVSLKRLLNADGLSLKKVPLLRTREHTLDDRRSELIKHIGLLADANDCYTLKRGTAASKTSQDNTRNDDTALRRLARSLERSTAEVLESALSGGSSGSKLFYLLAQIDQIIRTILRLLNYRASSLWRADKKLTTSRDSWILYDDINAVIQLFDGISLSIHHFIATDNVTKQAEALGPKSSSNFQTSSVLREQPSIIKLLLSLQYQVLKLRLAVLPSLSRRIENFLRCTTTEECRDICTSCLKTDSFICAVKVSSLEDRTKSSSKDLHVGDRIIDTLDRNYYSPAKTILLESNFSSVIDVLSVGFNNCLIVLLEQILLKKLRFNQGGVIALYSTLQQLKSWIVGVKNWLRNSSYCSIATNSSSEFKFIQDMGPWVEANLILEILQTGKSVLMKKSGSEELMSSQNKRNRKVPNRYLSPHLHSTVVPLGSPIEESSDVTVLEKLLPGHEKKNENLFPRNNIHNRCTHSNQGKDLRLRSLDNASYNFTVSRFLFQLDSMQIFYNFSETEMEMKVKVKMKNKSFGQDEYRQWLSLAVASETKKHFPNLPFVCCSNILPRIKRSSVSVCVVLDLSCL
jgi:hypothetical protein